VSLTCTVIGNAVLVFVDDPDEVPAGATPFVMGGVALSHHDGDGTFEILDGLYEYRRRALLLGRDPA